MKAGQNVSVGKSVWPSILGSNLIRILLKIDDATERRHIWSIGKQSLLGVLRRLVIYYSMASYIRNHPPKSNKSFIFCCASTSYWFLEPCSDSIIEVGE